MRSLRWDGAGPAVALLVTVAMGVWLRWALAGVTSLPAPFPHLRHAHSHMGYFGLLFPLAWMAWRQAGAKAPSRPLMVIYGLATAAAFVGFIHDGYGVVSIVASTVVAAVWLVSGWPLVARMSRVSSADPLAVVPLGIVLSLACVPPIAMTLRSDPTLAHGLVSTFLAGLLFLVIVPSALGAAGISPGPWPLLLGAGAGAALFLGVAPSLGTRTGLFAYAWLLGAPALSTRLRLHARLAWLAAVVGLIALALGWLPNNRPVALGAIHFLVLGPVLATLGPRWLRAALPEWYWWVGHGAGGAMSLALVAQGLGAGGWTADVAAIAGTATAVWWAGALLWQARASERRG